jgi:predicted nucleotide-binding protein (sugar kinase/HSP70/actin superfamily)
MKRMAFYQVGNSTIATDAFIRKLGFEAVRLPKINNDTITKGVSLSPEFACVPFKLSAGVLLQAIEAKADVFIMPAGGTIAACQLAEFGVAQQYILDRTNKKCEIILLDSFNMKSILDKFRKYNPKLALKTLAEAAIIAGQKFVLLEYLEELYHEIYIVAKKRKAEAFKAKFEKLIGQNDNLIELYMLKKIIKEERDKYPPLATGRMLRIGVIGDIYSINEPFINNNIFEKLCDLKVYAKHSIPLTTLYNKDTNISAAELLLDDEAEKYLRHNIGAYSKHSIKSALKYARMKYDGLIHICPFNCMPEIVVRNILPKISREHDIPILYLSLDEQTGDAGFTTRVEAFVDLIKIRKKGSNNLE